MQARWVEKSKVGRKAFKGQFSCVWLWFYAVNKGRESTKGNNKRIEEDGKG